MWPPRRLFGLLFHFSKNCTLIGSSNEPDWEVSLTFGHDVAGLVQSLSHKSPVSVAVLCSGDCGASRKQSLLYSKLKSGMQPVQGLARFPRLISSTRNLILLLLNKCLHHTGIASIVHATPGCIRQAWRVEQPAESLHVRFSNNTKSTMISSEQPSNNYVDVKL